MLLLIVVFASAIMIIMNYYTIRILSAARAYINGESQYSKGQKDASTCLLNYIYLENEADYDAFSRNIDIPSGDSIARVALLSKTDVKEGFNGFLKGKNRPEDINDMIWLFNNFKRLEAFEKAIQIWTSADSMVSQLRLLGRQVHKKITAGQMSAAEKKSFILSINNVSGKLTEKEQSFSNVLGVICRAINRDIFIINGLIILVILTSSLSYAGIMINNLSRSQKKVIKQNDNLQAINAALDNFVFNVAHDLRSPLASMTGLINLIEDEQDPETIKAYSQMIKKSLDKQDQFIREMLSYIKSKDTGTGANKTESSLLTIVDNVLSHFHCSNDGKRVNFYKEVELDRVSCDPLKVQVILNNLVSNSIKYSDPDKKEQWVKIKTYQSDTDVVVEVEDNGIGIRECESARIFDKFYSARPDSKSTGIGLFLVKDAVTKMNGSIELKSEFGLRTKFKVKIPAGS